MTTIDFHQDNETYSEMPFGRKKDAVSLDVYAKHPSTEVLMTAGAYDQEQVTHVEGHDDCRRFVKEAADNPHVIFHAFNAPFERKTNKEVLGIDIPIERWRCTMVHAYHLGFSGGLAEVGQQLGLPQEKQKLADGSRLIHKFSQPAPKNHKADRYNKENAPDDWERFKEYNIQDVVTEREIGLLLGRYPMPQSEWDLWFLDQRVNDRGLPIDKTLVEAGVSLFQEEKRHLSHKIKELTGIDNPNSGPQMLAWLNQYGYPYDNLKAETVDNALNPENLWTFDDQALAVLHLKQQLARTAGSKWNAFLRMTDWDTGRLRGAFQFAGASRTGRWGGRGAQPHNLHRSPKDQDEKIRSMLV